MPESEALQQIDEAIEKLRKAGCTRDRESGQWLSKDGEKLASDPLSAIRALRSRIVAKVMDEARTSGRHFTR